MTARLRPFDEVTLRLKQQLGVTQDKEVAAYLRIRSSAFAARKRRGSVPEKEIFALAGRRPDLDLDLDYVMNGRGASGVSQTAQPLPTVASPTLQARVAADGHCQADSEHQCNPSPAAQCHCCCECVRKILAAVELLQAQLTPATKPTPPSDEVNLHRVEAQRARVVRRISRLRADHAQSQESHSPAIQASAATPAADQSRPAQECAPSGALPHAVLASGLK